MACGNVSDTFKRLGIWGYVLIGIFVIVAGYFIILHQEHLAAYSSIIFVILFVVLHLFMHAGHGQHSGDGRMEGMHEGNEGHGGHEVKPEAGPGRAETGEKE